LATGIPLGNLIAAANENTAVLAVRKRLEKVTIVWAENAQAYDHAKGTSYANAFAGIFTPSVAETECTESGALVKIRDLYSHLSWL
jgi:hypothetical protein